MDLSCFITGHKEGHISVPSLISFKEAVLHAIDAGYQVEALYCLDRADALTTQLFEAYKIPNARVIHFDFGDQGEVRNAAIAQAEGQYCAFLDGDDLWPKEWLTDALAFLRQQKVPTIAHPEFNYFFEGQATLFEHIDQDDPLFSPDLLRLVNYWDALCVCPTQVHRDFPYCKRDMTNGWAYEDWHWNCETYAAGVKHKVVPHTLIFKRRQRMSQTIKASTSKALMRRGQVHKY